MSLQNDQSEFSASRFVSATAAGCYYAIEGRDPTAARQLLTQLLSKPDTPLLSDYDNTAREEILDLCRSGMVTLDRQASFLPQGNLSDLLPDMLPGLSERGRVVLTESRQGLYIDYAGVKQEEAEELAVLAADLRAIAEQRKHLLEDQLNISSRAYGIVDPAGNSEIGFWPLHIADKVFTLIVLGIPRFNTDEFRTLIWALSERYGV